jgi:hypothetical protein
MKGAADHPKLPGTERGAPSRAPPAHLHANRDDNAELGGWHRLGPWPIAIVATRRLAGAATPRDPDQGRPHLSGTRAALHQARHDGPPHLAVEPVPRAVLASRKPPVLLSALQQPRRQRQGREPRQPAHDRAPRADHREAGGRARGAACCPGREQQPRTAHAGDLLIRAGEKPVKREG